ncbi:MAG: RagB/SusD family nutrient uptake outer membrane protein, partial [Bacteroidales bacterium]|nr:RagB/SusD family nutrient uptake outer membrane protein [Bacteroidales bacterium]
MKKTILTPVIVILLASCVDLEEVPIGKVAPEGYFKSEKDMEGFVVGMYATITASRSPFAVFLMVDILSDDMDISQVNFRPYRYFLNQYEFNASNTIAGNSDGEYWVVCYSAVNCANIIIENAPKMTAVTEEKRLAFEAEARFIRAFSYFHLVRVNGDVPYNAKPLADPKEGKTKPRDSAEDIYRAIVEDLKFSIEHLPDQSSMTTSQGFSVRSRATRGAALGLL